MIYSVKILNVTELSKLNYLQDYYSRKKHEWLISNEIEKNIKYWQNRNENKCYDSMQWLQWTKSGEREGGGVTRGGEGGTWEETKKGEKEELRYKSWHSR